MTDPFVYNDTIIIYTFDRFSKIDPNYKYLKPHDTHDPFVEKRHRHYKENYYIVISSGARTHYNTYPNHDPFLIAKENLTQKTIDDVESNGVVQLEGKWKIYYVGGGDDGNYYISTPEQFKQIDFKTEYSGYLVQYPHLVIRDPWRGFIAC